VLDDAAAEVQKATGFRVLSHSLVFDGLCADCSAGSGQETKVRNAR
jgi:Fe2+ or Zn2+ uptake regulation protein